MTSKNVLQLIQSVYFIIASFIIIECSSTHLVINKYLRDNNNTTNLIRIARDTNACPSKDDFQCVSSKECLNLELVCDGKEDCKDASDEFESLCSDRFCPGYLFRCKYGACIDTNKKCNTIEDCKDGSDEENCPISSIPKVDTNCRSDEFECKNGQCISIDYKCDGVYHCDDKSDETSELCLNTYCPSYLFRCAYGACVNGNSKCNNRKDCLDGSDEIGCVPPVTREPVTPVTPPIKPIDGTTAPDVKSGCLTPGHPSHGRWVYLSPGVNPESGKLVPSSTAIKFTCDRDYQLLAKGYDRRDEIFVICTGNSETGFKWNIADMPQCHVKCQPYYNSQITTLHCADQTTNATIPCDRATDNTVLTYSCAPYYERPYGDSSTRYCSDGTWNLGRPECVQVCGEKRVTAEPLIVNGGVVERGNYPWVVAIYYKVSGKYQNICGGSILKENIVLTAAHCVTDAKGKKQDPALYMMGAGKYYNTYQDKRDTEAQYSTVKNFVVPDLYKADLNNYLGDIAIAVLDKPFALSKVVQPVCFNIENFQLRYEDKGIITGWGYTLATGNPSEVLKELELPYRNEINCERELPEEWAQRYLQNDKLCAGFYNNGTSVCKGDSGGGLVFPDKRGRYYVLGIVSIGHKINHSCNIQQSALFTRVEKYLQFVQSNTFSNAIRPTQK